jgi:hypothetical protein
MSLVHTMLKRNQALMLQKRREIAQLRRAGGLIRWVGGGDDLKGWAIADSARIISELRKANAMLRNQLRYA